MVEQLVCHMNSLTLNGRAPYIFRTGLFNVNMCGQTGDPTSFEKSMETQLPTCQGILHVSVFWSTSECQFMLVEEE